MQSCKTNPSPPPLSAYAQKEEWFQFYLHQRWSGPDRNQLVMADHKQQSLFGQSVACDWPVTQGHELSSKLVARARGVSTGVGMPVSSAQSMNAFSIKFEDYRHLKGSTLELRGPCDAPYDDIDWAVLGGTGQLTLAQGIAKGKMYHEDSYGRSYTVFVHLICYPGFTIGAH